LLQRWLDEAASSIEEAVMVAGCLAALGAAVTRKHARLFGLWRKERD
jgi:hypothetical protein